MIHESLHLDKWSFVQWKIMDIPESFIGIIIFFAGAFEYAWFQHLRLCWHNRWTSL
jgi:hypothetical protein